MTETDGDQLALVRVLKAQNRALEQENQSLKGGGGGGTSGGMDGRLGKLEAQMEHVQSDLAKLAGVPVDIATIKSEMVTKEYLAGKFDGQLAKIGILVTIIATIFGAVIHLVSH